jgi:iron complex outermembrane recepter protein
VIVLVGASYYKLVAYAIHLGGQHSDKRDNMKHHISLHSGSVAIYLALGALPIAMAQSVPSGATTSTPQTTQLPAITINVTRTDGKNFETPASLDVVDRKQIEDAKWQVNLSEVLGPVPGLVVNNRGNYAQDLQISSRGFGARTAFGVRGIRIYVDGIPGNSPDGQGQVSHIDLGSAQQIEVLRGPFSSIYGNSSGGVINVTTQEGGPDTVATTSLSGGSSSSYRLAQKISGATGAFNYVLDVSRFTTDGWRDHSAAQKDNINARLGFKISPDTKAVVVINRVNLPDAQDAQGVTLAGLSTPRSVPAAVLTFDTRKSTQQTQAGVDIEHRLNAEHVLKLAGYRGQREVTQYQSITLGAQSAPSSAGGVVDFERDYHGAEARWTFKRLLSNGPLLLHAGLTADRLKEQRKGFENFVPNTAVNPDPLCVNGTIRLFTCGVKGKLRRDEDNALQSSDQYVQGQWWPAADVSLHAGVRRSSIKLQSQDKYIVTGNADDSGSVKYSGTTPMLGVLYNFNDRVNLYASWGKGFDAPTLNEIAYNPDSTKTGLNLALKPARSQQWELGTKIQLPDQVRLQAAVFSAKTQDEIVVLSNNGGRSRFQNAGGTRRDGLELSFQKQFAQGWKTQWAYTYLRATYSDTFKACFATTCTGAQGVTVPAGNLIPGVPRQTLFADLAWSSTGGAVQAGLEWRATGKVAANDLNTEFAPGYNTLAAQLSFNQKLGNWDMREFVRVDNLTSKSYVGSVIVNQASAQYYEPAPTRAWLLGVVGSYKF